MTAASPLLAAGLAQETADLHSMLACAQDWAGDLYEGRRLPEEWNPGLYGTYGARDIAVEEADAVVADLRRQLHELEANGTAPGGVDGNGETR